MHPDNIKIMISKQISINHAVTSIELQIHLFFMEKKIDLFGRVWFPEKEFTVSFQFFLFFICFMDDYIQNMDIVMTESLFHWQFEMELSESAQQKINSQ